MEVIFAEPAVEALVIDGDARGIYGARVVACLRVRIQALMAAPTERALFSLRALELQKSNEGDDYSMRLDDEFRINVSFEDRGQVRHAIVHTLTRQSQTTNRPQS